MKRYVAGLRHGASRVQFSLPTYTSEFQKFMNVLFIAVDQKCLRVPFKFQFVLGLKNDVTLLLTQFFLMSFFSRKNINSEKT